jgi:hypothetical protein
MFFNQMFAPNQYYFNSDASVLKKITKFTYNYITFVIDNPYLPFVIQEMNNNPEYVMKFLKQDHRLDSSILISQIEKEIKVGIIKPINQSNFWLISLITVSHLQHKC